MNARRISARANVRAIAGSLVKRRKAAAIPNSLLSGKLVFERSAYMLRTAPLCRLLTTPRGSYFESWTVGGDGCEFPPFLPFTTCQTTANRNSTGRTRSIQSLPIDSLTHINVGFGYIKPGSFEVYPMDTSEEVYREIANLKRRAPGLKIWISLGGWTFNDPGPTQNVFSDLASSADKRMKFIENLAKFMRSCGFDGVDIDWELSFLPCHLFQACSQYFNIGSPVLGTLERQTAAAAKTTATTMSRSSPA